MRSKKIIAGIACTAIVLSTVIVACTKDSGFITMRIYTPVYKSTASVRAAVKAGSPEAIHAAGKMFLAGNYILLNEVNKGIHIIDNSNPASPVNKAFIPIPGNLDITVKGNTLYADSYTDLLVIDISNMQSIQCKTYIANLFPDRSYVLGSPMPNGQIVIDWTERDTTVRMEVAQGQGIWKNSEYYYFPGGVWQDFPSGLNTADYSNSQSSTKSSSNIAGSESRFAIINNYLYTVSTGTLSSIDISNPFAPKLAGYQGAGVNGESIFTLNNKLFIGGSTGISVFSVDNASAPESEGGFGHFCSNDPVIADGNIAYVTLSANNRCQGDVDELDVLDVSNMQAIKLIKTYPLSGPKGLSKDGNTLFICDGAQVKVFNAANSNNITLQQTIKVNSAYDVICYNKIAYVSAAGGLYQFDYHDLTNIKQLSKIALQ